MVRKMMFALVAAAGFFASSSSAWASGLYFKNYTSETIYLSVVNFEAGGWRIDGWYSVEPRRTVQIIQGDLGHRYYYFHAYTASRRSIWEGNHRFMVDPSGDPFTILRVNNRYGALPQGARLAGFQEIDTGTARTVTVNLN